jgi:hypothetical protein
VATPSSARRLRGTTASFDELFKRAGLSTASTLCRTVFYNADARRINKYDFAAITIMPRNRRTLPFSQHTYKSLHDRVDRLEDTISYLYNVINELRRRVSTLEKKAKHSAKDGG